MIICRLFNAFGKPKLVNFLVHYFPIVKQLFEMEFITTTKEANLGPVKKSFNTNGLLGSCSVLENCEVYKVFDILV